MVCSYQSNGPSVEDRIEAIGETIAELMDAAHELGFSPMVDIESGGIMFVRVRGD
jgi:hypothetical protein